MARIFALLLFTCLTAPAFALAPAAVEDIRYEFETLGKHIKRPKELADIQNLAAADRKLAPPIAAALAYYYRTHGEPDKMKDPLKSFALKKDGSWNFDNSECCFEYVRMIASDDLAAAIKCIDHYGIEGNESQKVFAGETAGDIMADFNRITDAIRYYTFAKKFGNSDEYAKEHKLVPLALKRVDAALAKLQKEARVVKKDTAREKDLAKYGEEFVLYREAEAARKKDEFDRAIVLYDDLIKRYNETVFARASEMYAGYALKNLKRFPEAEKRWKTIVASEPWGLYRGEALVALAELSLFQNLDFKTASNYFIQADDWLKAVESIPTTTNPFQAPTRSIEVTKTPQNVVSKDAFGIVTKADPHDGALINHLTTPWYLDEIRMRVAANYGFTLMVEGRLEEAKEQFANYRKLDKLGAVKEKWAMGSFAHRIEWDLKNNQGCLRAYPDEAKAFTDPKRRLIMFMGDLEFEKENWTEAIKQYERLQRKEFGIMSEGEEAYVSCAVADCEALLENTKKAYSLYKQFISKWRNTPTAPRALLLYANTLSGGKRIEKDCDEAVKILDRITEQYPRYGDDSMYFASLTCILSDKESKILEGKQRMSQYRRLFPNGFHKDEATEEAISTLLGLKNRRGKN